MSLPVSQYEALLAEVRSLRRKAQRVQQLATPLISNYSTPLHQNDEVNAISSYKMEPLLTGRHASSTNYDGATTSSAEGDTTCSEDECGGARSTSTHMSVSSEPIAHRDRSVATLYHGTWPVERTMWNSEPTPHDRVPAPLPGAHLQEVTSVMSFASSAGGVHLDRILGSSQQLEAKVDMVYSLLAMLSGQEHADMGETLLALSTSPESCLAMRQSGCIPLLVQMVQSDRDADARRKAAQAIHNLVHSQPDEKLRKREVRIFKLLELTRAYTEAVRGNKEVELEVTSSVSDGDDRHPVQTVAHLMKLSFDELHRQAICTLGGIHTIANLVEAEHAIHGSTADEAHCILLRRYACMALTNLTFGDSGNKALLCSFREFMRALVVQLQSPSDELRQVTASVLRNLSWRADSSSKEILREVGSVSGLMKAAMLDNKENTLKSILSALWNLSAHCTENKSEICSVEGALGFLVQMLTYKTPSKSLAIIENSGGILRNISSQIAVRDDYREVLRRHGCLQILLDQLKSPSLTIVSNACGTLWNLSAKCALDQEALWQMGAPAMLRSLNHSKHKMIAMGSSAALKNLLGSKPTQTFLPAMDATALAMDLPVLPTLGARKQKALLQDLDQTLAETYENIEDSPVKNKHSDSHSEPSTSSKSFVKNRSFTGFDSGLESPKLLDEDSIDNDRCESVKLKEVSVYSDEKDNCSIEDVSDEDAGFFAVRKDVANSSAASLPLPCFKYANLAASNVTMFEGDIDEIDMEDISIHFASGEDDTEKRDVEKEKNSNLHEVAEENFTDFIGICTNFEDASDAKCPKIPNRGIPLPRSLPRPIPSSSVDLSPSKKPPKSNIARLSSSALPRRSLQHSTPIKSTANEAPKVQNIDDVVADTPSLIQLSSEAECSLPLNISQENNASSAEGSPRCFDGYLSPVKAERERLLERSCEESNLVDNRMLDPDAMIESLDRFTAELVSQASHLQQSKDNNNTWNEDTSPNEVTFPSISGSAPNVITFEDDVEEPAREPEKSNDFSSINTSTMTESTLIAIEATKMATIFKNEAEMSNSISSVVSLELDKIQPPSLFDSLTNSGCSLEFSRSPKLAQRKRSIPMMVRRALGNSVTNLEQQTADVVFTDVMDASVSDLENVNPPSIFTEITDLCSSLAIGSETEIFEDCVTHLDDVTEAFSDATSTTPMPSDANSSSAETSPKKRGPGGKAMMTKQRRNLARDRYKTYTVAAEMVLRQEEDVQTGAETKATKLTPKERRQLDRSRFETQVVEEAITDILQQPVIASPPKPKSSIIRKNFDLQKEANLVLKSLRETKTSASDDLLDCETLSLVSNDDDSVEVSGSPVNYRTYHKSWGLKKNVPVIEDDVPKTWSAKKSDPVLEPAEDDVHEISTKPKIVKPSSIASVSVEEDVQTKAIRGRRKPLYSKSPKSLKKPLKTMTSNIVKNVTSSIKSVKQTNRNVVTKPPVPQSSSRVANAAKPKLERQGTFTKDEAPSGGGAGKSRIPTKASKIPGIPKRVGYGRSTSAEATPSRRVQSSSSSQSLKIDKTKKASGIPSTSSNNGTPSAKKQVTSKIASLWKKIEESKSKQPVKKDTRVWIQSETTSSSTADNKNGVPRRGSRTQTNDDCEKRVSRLGSFIVMDESEDAVRVQQIMNPANV